MASIVRRGSRSEPRFFAKWSITTADGEKKQRWRLLPGIVTLKDARAALPEIERKVAEGNREPLAQPPEPKSAESLLLKWADTLTNRNAGNDRTMVRRYLIPRFGRMVLEEITIKAVLDWLE